MIRDLLRAAVIVVAILVIGAELDGKALEASDVGQESARKPIQNSSYINYS